MSARGMPIATAGVDCNNMPHLGQQQQQPVQQQHGTQLLPQAGKNITLGGLAAQNQLKSVYCAQTVVDGGGMQQQQQQPPQQQLPQQHPQQQHHQQQLQLVHAQMRTQGNPRFRSPAMCAPSVPGQVQGQVQGASSTTATASGGGNFDQDLEDSITAAVVKREHLKAVGVTSPMGTTLTSFYPKESDDDNRLLRTQNNPAMTLAEFKKRSLPAMRNVVQVRSGGQPGVGGGGSPAASKLPLANTTGQTVPVARVAPQKIFQLQQQQPQPLLPVHHTNANPQPQQLQQQSELASAHVGQVATSSSSSVHQTSHNNYEIQTQHVLQNRNGQQMGEKDRNSAKMLVILNSGEQRLITFTLPRESCTVQDLLEQVGVPFDSSTTIQCVENPGANIDFVVTVGFSVQESASELISRAEQSLQMSRQQENSMAAAATVADPAAPAQATSAATSAGSGVSAGATAITPTNAAPLSSNTPAANNSSNMYGTAVNTAISASRSIAVAAAAAAADADVDSAPKESTASNNNTKTVPTGEDVPRKIIQGFYAICQICGFSGYDHAKCERCNRLFHEPPKRVPCVKVPGGIGDGAVGEKKRPGGDLASRSKAGVTFNGQGGRGRGGAPPQRGRSTRSGRRAQESEPVILTLSSDDEDDDYISNTACLGNPGVGSTTKPTAVMSHKPFLFEPMLPEKDEEAIYADFTRDDISDLSNSSEKMRTALSCKQIRVGTYRFEPHDPVEFTSKGILIQAPKVGHPKEIIPLHIHRNEVVKIIAHFSKASESMMCFYTLRTCATYIKNMLNIKNPVAATDGYTFFSPNGQYQMRKIIMQFDTMSDQAQDVIKSLWDFFDDISQADAHKLLQRAAESDSDSVKASNDSDATVTTTTQLNPNEIRQLLIYPPGKGGISINTEDYLCLATDQYLNDIIIDFYLKWVHNNIIPEAQRDRTFIFSTFFYKRLTTMTRQHHQQEKQTAAQKRHARVQNWTKNVNLFDKDYVIIPINEQSHWFLAIICFPKLKGPVTYDTNVPVDPQHIKKQKGKKVSVQIGNTTITPLSKRENSAAANMLAEVCGLDEDSERDEAEGDESELASEDSDFENSTASTTTTTTTTTTTNTNTTSTTTMTTHMVASAPIPTVAAAPLTSTGTVGPSGSGSAPSTAATTVPGQPQAIKQPLILIFDSLAGASRNRVVATLRDYLTCEYRVKMGAEVSGLHAFNKDNMPGHCVKVPQQNNFTDCGLFLLQYVEQFFKDPIRDYRLPIKQLNNWFDTLIVTRKREDISNLLQTLMNERNGPNQKIILPEIPFPTLNGQLVEPPEGYNIEFEEEEMDEDASGAAGGDEEDEDMTSVSGAGADSSELGGDELNGYKVAASSSTAKAKAMTTAVVPTQGRKIVVKRRMQIFSSSSGSCSGSNSGNGDLGSSPTQATTMRTNSVKIRKLEQ